MANIPLQSISFPGLSDKYTTPTVDTTLTQTGAAADAKKTGDEIGAIKNDLSDGTMTVNNAENAEQLTSTVGIEDTAPYLFRTSGGSNDIGDREDVKKIVGGTIVNNQLVDTSTESVTVTSGHKAYKNIGGTTSIAISDGTAISVTGGTDIVTDITQMLGTTIADYVYSLETATAGAGVAWLKKHFPDQFNAGYQAYDAGSMQSVSGLTAHKMVGFNQWDEVAEVGGINSSGELVNDSRIRSKNFIPVIPSTAYCYTKLNVSATTDIRPFYYDGDKNFIQSGMWSSSADVQTTPANCRYMKFYVATGYGTTYNHDICINFHWDGEKDGTYEPYKTWSYALDDSITLRGIPKVDANGNLYYDGDEYLPDGTVNRRYGIVDMGSISWIYDTNSVPHFLAQANQFPQKTKFHGGLVCVKFIGTTKTYNTLADLEMCVDNSEQVPVFRVRDDAYTSAADFKTAMSGVYLVYELATPTTETALPYQETQIVDDFGTEEFVLADGAFPIPVGHDTMYQNNLRAKLEMSPDSPDGDGLYVVQQESGENTYVPLASTATIQDILTRLTALENA